MKNYSPIILVGKAQNHFDYKLNLLKPVTFKYLLVKEVKRNEWQMLLMVKDEEFDLDADALLWHMQDNGLLEIIVHGGGYLDFSHDMHFASISEFSIGFKSSVLSEAVSFLRKIWISIKSVNTSLASDISEDDIKAYHKIYTLDEVRKKDQ